MVTTHLYIWGGGGLCVGEGLEKITEGCSPVPSSPHPYPISCLNPFCHVPSKTSPSFFCFSLGTRNLLPSEVTYPIRYMWLSGSKTLSNCEMGMWWEGGKVQELLNKLLFYKQMWKLRLKKCNPKPQTSWGVNTRPDLGGWVWGPASGLGIQGELLEQSWGSGHPEPALLPAAPSPGL